MEVEYDIIDRSEKEDAVLIRFDNEVFDTVALVYHLDTDQEEIYLLTDMQGKFPVSFEEVTDYTWCRAEDVDY